MDSSRRTFLVASGLTALSATRAWGANDVIRTGAIGCGGRMHSALIPSAMKAQGVQIVAVCDVYQPHIDAARAKIGAPDITSNADYKAILDDKNIDAVIIGSPDHWHVKMASDAVAAGKDVYLEKPVTHTIEQGDVLIRAVRESKRVLQCGMQQRSWIHFQSAVDLIQGGSIGRVTQVRTYWYQNYQSTFLGEPIDTSKLDWKAWLGSAPEQPFTEEKYHRWRWFWDFGGGAMTDLFTHWIDVVHWAMKSDTPQVAQTLGDTYYFDQWQCPDTIESSMRYPKFQVGYEGTMVSSIDDGGLEFRGTEGTLKINRGGFGIHRENAKENPALSERSIIDGTVLHMQNFYECVRSRKEPNAPVETGVAAARAGHIGNLALRRNQRITWPLHA